MRTVKRSLRASRLEKTLPRDVNRVANLWSRRLLTEASAHVLLHSLEVKTLRLWHEFACSFQFPSVMEVSESNHSAASQQIKVDIVLRKDCYLLLMVKATVHSKNDPSRPQVDVNSVKFCSQANISGASQQNSVILNSWSRRGLVLKQEKNTEKKTLNCSFQPVKNSPEALRSQIDLKRCNISPSLHGRANTNTFSWKLQWRFLFSPLNNWFIMT